jgi:gliding motility-associated-like protein
MKKSLQLVFLLFSFVFLLKNETKAQTVTQVINYGVFTGQCCSGNTIGYQCYNDACGSCTTVCGTSAASNTQTFINPVPAGNIVTQVDAAYDALNCGGSASATINGCSIGSTPITSGSCLCSGIGAGTTGSTGTNFPCGFSCYNNAAGASETFVVTFGGEVCIVSITLTFHYAPASQAVPATEPTSITGPTPVCAGSSNVYSCPAVANATGYTWTVPAGWTITSGQGTTSINVTAGAAGGNICVDASNLCGTSAQQCKAVTIATTPATPGAPSGTTTMCSGANVIFTTTGSAGATSYNWTVPAGAVINSGQGTTSINVTMGASSGNVCVTASNACGTSAAACTAITIGGVQPTPGAPSGTAGVCGGSTQVYTTTGSAGATSYNWTVPAGTTINSGQGTTSINVTIGSTSGNICVTATGACGTSAAACTPITITSAPTTPGSITGATPVCPGSDNYSISSVAGATSYTWSVTGGGGTISGGQGTTAATIFWTTGGSDIVSVTATNACGTSTSATFPVTVNPSPVISITPSSAAICSGGSVATLTASGASTYTWLPNPTITSPLIATSVTVMPTNTATPTVYTVTGSNGSGCSGIATQAIAVNPSPTVSVAGGSGTNAQTVCSGGAVTGITFSATPAGTFNWTNNNIAIGIPGSGITNAIPGYTAPTVSVQTVGVITVNAVASSSGCSSTAGTDLTYTITINPPPTAPVFSSSVTPNPVQECQGQVPPSINVASTGTISSIPVWYNGSTYVYTGTSYVPNTTTLGTTVYTVIDSATVTGCSSLSAAAVLSVTVIVNALPTPAISTTSGGAICAGSCTTLSVTPTGPNLIYQWGTVASGGLAGETSSTYTACAAGSYTVLVTNTTTGCSAVASALGTITVSPVPTIDTAGLGNTQSSCTAPTGSITNVTISAGTPAYTYSWTSGVTIVGTGTGTPASLSNVSAGNYCLNVTDANGCTASFCHVAVTDVGAPATPTLSLGNTTTYCQGQSLQTLTVTVASTGTTTPTVNWYNNSTGTGVALATGTNTYTPTGLSLGTNTIYAIATSAGCNSIALPITITINPLPAAPVLTASLTNPVNECSGVTPAPTISVSASGTVTATPVWYLGGNMVNVGTTYAPSTAIVGTTVYTIIDSVAIPNGCTSAAAGAVLSLTVTINATPTPPTLVNVTNPIPECQGQTPAITATVTPATGTTPVWYSSTGSVLAINTDTYTPPNGTAGTTTYIVIDSSLTNGCTSAATGSVLPVVVIVNPAPTPPVLTSTNNVYTDCQGVPTTPVTVNTGTTSPAPIPVWYNSSGMFVGIGSPFSPPSTIGTNTYTVVDSSSTGTGCFSLSSVPSQTIVVTVYASPTITVAGSGSITPSDCGNPGSVSVNPSSIISSGANPLHYQWYNGGSAIAGDTTLNLTVTPTAPGGTYSLQVTDANGCHAISAGGVPVTYSVPAIAKPVISFSTTPNPATGYIPLAVTFSNQTTGATSYIWTFGDGNTSTTISPTYTYNNVGTYTVMLIASNGVCKDTATTIVISEVATTIIIPNIFSPNGDNINDLFFIVNTGMSTLNCNIFNRWGQLLYTITAPDQSWDGRTPNGDQAPDGTYLYILQAQGLNGKTYKQQGTVTLVR